MKPAAKPVGHMPKGETKSCKKAKLHAAKVNNAGKDRAEKSDNKKRSKRDKHKRIKRKESKTADKVVHVERVDELDSSKHVVINGAVDEHHSLQDII